MHDRNQLVQDFLESTGLMYRCMLPVKNRIINDLGLNRSQLEVMMFILRNENPTIKDISHALNITSSAATQLVEGLSELDYVSRKDSVIDRRLVNVHLTKKGRSKCLTFKKFLFEIMTKKLVHIHDKELQLVSDIARRITSEE